MAPEWTRIASESRRRSPPLSPSSGFSASSPLNRKRPSSARAWFGVSLVARWVASSTVPVEPISSACWESSPELDVVAAAQLAAVELALARPARVISVVLPEPLAPDERDVLAALEPQLGVLQQHPIADLQQPVLDLEDHAARALGRLEGEAERLAVARVALDALDLVELLLARLGLARARARAEAGDEALELGDLGLLALDRAARAPARAAPSPSRQACQVPLKNFARPRLELEHGGADRLQEPAVVGHEHDRGVERLQVRLQPLERGDVEVVGRLVEQQQVGIAGQRPRQRGAGQLAAGERLQRAVEVLVAEAEPVQRRVDAPRASCSRRRARAGSGRCE